MDLKDLAYIGTTAIEILIPIILAIIIWKKFKVSWAIFFLGMLLFLASLIRTPLNNYLGGLLQSNLHGEIFYISFGIMAGLTTGLFEEGSRILAFGVIIKPGVYQKGIMYGIGHGGGGSMIFVGLSTIANYIIYKFFPSILPVNLVAEIKSSIWYLPYIGALGRVFGISIQIAFSVLILHAFISKKYYIIPLTIIFHAAVDFIAFYLNYKFGIWFAEISIFVFAIIGIAIIVLLRPRKNSNQYNGEKFLVHDDVSKNSDIHRPKVMDEYYEIMKKHKERQRQRF
ncbi:MAG: YhfC family glutamic-type intramembrane protease [Candidatus Humimicrobiaceae bacterium]